MVVFALLIRKMVQEGNVHLYEKVGYHQTGEIEHIKDGKDITIFEKN